MDVAELQVCVRGSAVTIASDYNKRRHVVRLTTPGGTQLLLQADSHSAMNAWLNTLHQHAHQVMYITHHIIDNRLLAHHLHQHAHQVMYIASHAHQVV